MLPFQTGFIQLEMLIFGSSMSFSHFDNSLLSFIEYIDEPLFFHPFPYVEAS